MAVIDELIEATKNGKLKIKNEIFNLFVDLFEQTIKPSIFKRANEGFDFAYCTVKYPNTCLTSAEVKKEFEAVLFNEGFNNKDIEYNRYFHGGFEVILHWEER